MDTHSAKPVRGERRQTTSAANVEKRPSVNTACGKKVRHRRNGGNNPPLVNDLEKRGPIRSETETLTIANLGFRRTGCRNGHDLVSVRASRRNAKVKKIIGSGALNMKGSFASTTNMARASTPRRYGALERKLLLHAR